MIRRQSFILLISLLLASTTVLAWQFRIPQPSTATNLNISRRSVLANSPTAAAILATAIFVTPLSALATSSEAAKDQWAKSVSEIDKLLRNWPSGGDAIRVELGTQGTTSPLFQIDKVLKVLREDTDDIVEFTELVEEFQLTLSRADSMAYSANFAGGSGKPTPPAVYIEKAKKEVESLQQIAKSLSALI